MGRGDQDEQLKRPAGSGAILLFGRRARRGMAVGGLPPTERQQRRQRIVIESDEQLLELYDQGKLPVIEEIQSAQSRLADATVIGRSADLFCDSNSGGKHYRGYVAVSEGAGGEPIFVGAVAYGPWNAPERQGQVVYVGGALDSACKKVNDRLGKKLSPSARSVYAPQPGSGDTSLSAARIRAQLEQAASAESA